MNKGIMLTLEGGEGAGKSYLIGRIKELLESKGLSVVVTREPGGIEIAEQIRSIILDPQNTKMDPITEALLYASARRQHLVEKIIPALDQGKVVLCDRFIDSSLAYQGYARGLGIEKVFSINKLAVQNCMPQLTLLLDCTPEVGLARIHIDKHREVNRLDLENLEFHRKVREGYLKLAEMYPDRIEIINAGQSKESVFSDVEKVLNNKLIE